ncbi:TrkA family potassium uptake protein [Nocardioides seonyuensis]|uniref:TrkA family potassium uptake protein n=1 Tax=Nocardioides seonyuensis TaxID=2518371 RepID=A0A4P7IEW3_9ACTN|nr:TrkA family potassium uptake protein [Nocardioides seonyuensis]QBX54221.1 TrkA family potassium uptake protein [Nocardioides seonyuensis]
MGKHRTNGVVVIGLGRFGRSLALELVAQGEEVLGIDGDPKIVAALAGRLTHVVEADSTNEDAMRQLSVGEFSRAVIGVGTNLEVSILSASIALELGVQNVWAKAISASHAKILEKLGVHHVVRPEHDMGKRVAHLVRGEEILDYIEFDEGYAFAKSPAPRALHGRSLQGYGVRQEFGITVVAVKRLGQTFAYATPESVIREGDQVVVSGPADKVEAFCNLR